MRRPIRSTRTRVSVRIPTGEDGLAGRECPQRDCRGYFKVQLGTGLTGRNLPCHCPYCNYTASHSKFHTAQQLKYVKAVARRKMVKKLYRGLKGSEFDRKPTGPLGVSLSLKVKPPRRVPVHLYREPVLETVLVCEECALRYAVYGVFAYCPDCGSHNSQQIFEENLRLVLKVLALGEESTDASISERLIGNALEDCVGAFDGFGREVCRLCADHDDAASRLRKMSFQDPDRARQRVLEACGFDLSGSLENDEWKELVRGFQKRHLLAHTLGIIDEEYVRRSGDSRAVVGRKVRVTAEEVRELVRTMRKISRAMVSRRRVHSRPEAR